MIKIFDSNCYAKIAEVEGPGFVKQEANHLGQVAELGYSLSRNSFTGAVVNYAKEQTTQVIYGVGGWHRYVLREDGEVTFSKYHCPSEEICARAREVGFSVE